MGRADLRWPEIARTIADDPGFAAELEGAALSNDLGSLLEKLKLPTANAGDLEAFLKQAQLGSVAKRLVYLSPSPQSATSSAT